MAKTTKKAAKKSASKNAKKARKAADTAAPPRRRSFWRFAINWGGALMIWGLVVVGGIVAFYAYDLPDVETALSVDRRPSVTIVAADGPTVAAFGDLYAQPVTVHDLPPWMSQAVLAIEDRRFYSHFGVDPFGLIRALLTNLSAGRVVQGGSTITQQVAKNLFLSRAKTIKRKVQELLLAFWLERKFSKDQILTLYLNRVYLGSGTYGVEAAAQRYFGKSARDVSLYEAAMLAGSLKAPSRYNPANSRELADKRAHQVLQAMVDAGFLSAVDVKQARAAGRRDGAGVGGYGRHFTAWVLDRTTGFVGRPRRNITVATTLDARLQQSAEKILKRFLAGPGAKAKVGEAAVIVMTPDGGIRAMVGGRNFRQSQFNRATQALRQPGSAFKPIVYLAGLEAGLRPDSRFEDAPITIDGWSPRNYDRRYRGTMTLRDALAQSINTVAVRVIRKAGIGRTIATARRLGITSALEKHHGLALGSSEVTLLELTAAYAALANGGVGVWPHAIREIRDTRSDILFARSGGGPGRVVQPRQVADLHDMLQSTIATGTGKRARIGRRAAGKTGTSQDSRDAWFVGYTADLVAGIWLGNDSGAPMVDVSGGGWAALLWRDIMKAAHQGLPDRPLRK